jgi:hypothetical protein
VLLSLKNSQAFQLNLEPFAQTTKMNILAIVFQVRMNLRLLYLRATGTFKMLLVLNIIATGHQVIDLRSQSQASRNSKSFEEVLDCKRFSRHISY